MHRTTQMRAEVAPPPSSQPHTPDQRLVNEVASAGPSGDSEIVEDDGHQSNEVGPGSRGVADGGAEPDLTGNTVDSGSSAAQLPQKNILERKEVLIGELFVCRVFKSACRSLKDHGHIFKYAHLCQHTGKPQIK